MSASKRSDTTAERPTPELCSPQFMSASLLLGTLRVFFLSYFFAIMRKRWSYLDRCCGGRYPYKGDFHNHIYFQCSKGVLPEHLNRGHITRFLSLRPPIPILVRY